VVLGQNEQVLDSTLLDLIGMVEKAAMKSKGWFSPSDQAIIVAGDIDRNKVIQKLKLLSYILPSSESLPRGGYVWVEQDSLQVVTSDDNTRNAATVSAVWRLQRTPHEYMNTVQPVIYERFMRELGIIAGNRLRTVLEDSEVPVADVSYDYVNSVASLGDENFLVKVTVAPEHLEEATSALASVMSGLDAGDVEISELRRAGLIFMEDVNAGLNARESNSSYIDRCIAAFMYNSSLSSGKEIASFHASRNLSDDVHLKIFNSIDLRRIESYLSAFAHQCVRSMIAEQTKRLGLVLHPEKQELVCDIYCYSMVGLLLKWISAGMKEDPHVLVEEFCSVIKGTLDIMLKNSTDVT
jgi:hypothetical protein